MCPGSKHSAVWVWFNVPNSAGLSAAILVVFFYHGLNGQWGTASAVHHKIGTRLIIEAGSQMEVQTPRGSDICN